MDGKEAPSPTVLGLSSVEASLRLHQFGPNEIQAAEKVSAWKLLLAQFNSPLIWLLGSACLIAGAIGEMADAIAIITIVIINGCVGFFQEYRAEQAVQALRAITAPRARVLRNGKQTIISAAEVVPDDILLLEAGDVVAADAVLLSAHSLSINEAALTGESVPSEKRVESVLSEIPLADRHGHVFLGTAVVNGTGTAKVAGTGMNTELGKIARLLAATEKEITPLQRRLASVSGLLLGVCLAIVALVALLGVLRGVPWTDVFISAVSLAVAAVPEGLPAVVTIALSVGVQRMASRHVLIRRLLAVEALGCATVICTDKTGTLTTGVMSVRELRGGDHYELLRAAASCCDAELAPDGQSGVGESTEIALLVAAFARGIFRETIENQNPRVVENPFDSVRKRMSILRADERLYVKGAPEMVLPLCRGDTSEISAANTELSSRGLRVIAVGIGVGREEQDLELLGLVAIADPPRPEAVEAVAKARRAGIRTVMITGDHPATATAIAKELGLIQPDDDPADYVHARATPEDKLRIVKTWKANGAIVAMTGDGVNDAPALREANIGVAMGKNGTEVTREAADVVLADDNFASIIAGVEEGRGIFQNIRKTLTYLLSGNAGELMLMLAAGIVGLPIPLLPLHLLWINLATDGLPALALVTDPVDKNAMSYPPRDPNEPILGRSQWTTILLTGLLQAAVSLGVFIWALEYREVSEARNLAFSTLVVGELLRAFSARSETLPIWELGLLTNLRLLGVVVASLLLQLAIHHFAVTQSLFQISSLSVGDCLLSFACGSIPLVVIESSKVVMNFYRPYGDLAAARRGRRRQFGS